MKIVNKKVKDLIPYEKNTKKHDKTQINNVAESIKQYGFVQPLVIDKDNVVVIGHCRLLGAKQLGMDEVPCVCVDDLTEEQVNALRIVDNKSNESEWDIDFLVDELQDVDLSMFDFDFGLDGIENDETEIVEDEAPEVDEENEPIAKLGDIWQLGRHRLMCGDSTDKECIKKLMNGENAKILFTSPPYSDMREYNGNKDLSVTNISKFISAYQPYTKYQCVNLGIQRKEFEIIPYWNEYIDEAHEAGYKLMAWNVWDKTMCGSVGQQSAFIPIRHEWIFVFGTEFFDINKTWDKKEESIKFTDNGRVVRQADGTTKRSTRGDMSSPKKQMESVTTICAECGSIRHKHPATFPVGLPSEYILAMTDRGDNVIEPFCGSGTTLIACEQTGRNCYGMEMDEKYCDVIIKRWEDFTGEKAIKIN